MLRGFQLAVVGASLILAGCVVTTLEPTNVAPTYKVADKALGVVPADSCASLSKVVIEDARTQKELGTRTLVQTGATQPVSFKSDPTVWVREGTTQMLQRAKIDTDVAGKPVLRLKISRLALNERVNRLATYDGRLDITAEVMTPGSANPCWTIALRGISENIGSAGTAENYEKTMNLALERALLQLVNNSEFSNKLCGVCPR